MYEMSRCLHWDCPRAQCKKRLSLARGCTRILGDSGTFPSPATAFLLSRHVLANVPFSFPCLLCVVGSTAYTVLSHWVAESLASGSIERSSSHGVAML